MPAPRALFAPPEPVVVLDEALVARALEASRQSDRKRVIQRFHKDDAEPVHRMFNAMQPGTYARPHRHHNPPKCEVFLLLRGALDFVVFDEQGGLRCVHALRAGSERFGVDLSPGIFHGLLIREPDTLIYEVKAGPYSAMDDKDFAPWAPVEGSPEVPAYLAELERRVSAQL